MGAFSNSCLVLVIGSTLVTAQQPSPAEQQPHPLNEQFFQAAKRGDLPSLKAFLNVGVNPSAKKDGLSALMLATIWRRVSIAEELLSRGAQIDSGYENLTPLGLAYRRGYPEIVALLMAKGARFGLLSHSVLSLPLLSEFNAARDAGATYRPNVQPETGKPDFTGVWDLDNQKSGKGKRSRHTIEIDHLGKYLLLHVEHGHDFWMSDDKVAGYLVDGSETKLASNVSSTVQWDQHALQFRKRKKLRDGQSGESLVETWTLGPDQMLTIKTEGDTSNANPREIFFKKAGPTPTWPRKNPI